MRTAVAALVVSFGVAVLLTPRLRDWARSHLQVDNPMDARRVHTRPTPRIGGVAIAVAFLVPFIALSTYHNQISDLIFADGRRAVTFLVGALVALGIGLADDFYRPSAKVRLAALTGLGVFTALGGYGVTQLGVPGLEGLDLRIWSPALTVLWVVGVMVAFNFIDGLDGLATGIALIASLTMFTLAYAEHNLLWMTWTGALAGSLLGFLVFNFNPASVFMGDAGSNFLGYVIAVIGLGVSRKESTAVALFVPMIAVGIPILDAALTMVRRALLRTGMFRSERGHLHHRLLDRGLSHRTTVLVLWGISAILAVGALTWVADVPVLKIAAALVIAGVVFSLALYTGYIRPYDLRRMYRRGLFNVERVLALRDACAAAGEGLPEGPLEDRLQLAMTRLVDAGQLTAARLSRSPHPDRDAGTYSEDAKGKRITLSGGSFQITMLWQDRTTVLVREEIQALQSLLDRIASAAPDGAAGEGASSQ